MLPRSSKKKNNNCVPIICEAWPLEARGQKLPRLGLLSQAGVDEFVLPIRPNVDTVVYNGACFALFCEPAGHT